MTIEVTLNKAKDLVLDVLRAKLVPMLHGSPGVGKSVLAQTIAKMFNLYLIDIRLSQTEPNDLMGFPKISDDKSKATYVPMDFFPVEGDTIPEGYDGWLILLDEFNSAPLAVQAAAYKIILDRMVGQHKLHKKAACIAAGNLVTDNAIVNRLSTATQTRLVHFTVEVGHKEWMAWATVDSDIDHRIISFLHFRPDLLHKFDPNHDDMTFPCPRTWEFCSNIIKHYEDGAIPREKLPVIGGTVGEGAAREFVEFTHIYSTLPTAEEILADPQNIPISDEPSVMFALTGMVANLLDVKNGDNLMKFIERMPIEFQFITLGNTIKKKPEIAVVPSIRVWMATQSKDMI